MTSWSIKCAAATVPISSSSVVDGKLVLKGGETIDIVSGLCSLGIGHGNLPLATGFIGNQNVSVLRDTGCTGVLVKKDFVSPRQYTGQYAAFQMVDGSMMAAPIARISVDTPYLVGEVNALCLTSMVCDLIIGNVSGAGDPQKVTQEPSVGPEAVKAHVEPQSASVLQDERTLTNQQHTVGSLGNKPYWKSKRKDLKSSARKKSSVLAQRRSDSKQSQVQEWMDRRMKSSTLADEKKSKGQLQVKRDLNDTFDTNVNLGT